uniref:Uncharacterized protein n=1 Tax=Lotus japonicus TaxID=34305 RepID=I3SUE4_LOTJA|nr:unknown [Lotus japonicus]
MAKPSQTFLLLSRAYQCHLHTWVSLKQRDIN